MKKKRFVLFLCFLISNLNILPAESQNKLNQEVTVTAVEVPVRVLHKNEIVKGLTKDDFEVFENGVKQKIFGFEIISRKIAGYSELGKAGVRQMPKLRLFILIFNIFDYNDAIGEAIDYFFKTIFHERDQIVILTEGRLLNIERGKNVDDVKTDLKETLKKYKGISTRNYFRAYLDLREECDRLADTNRAISFNWDQDISRFYENYERIWSAYRNQFLMPDMDLYQGLLKRIKPIKAEKWAICFQQRELFPQLKNQGRLEGVINMILSRQVDPQDLVKVQLIQHTQRRLQESFEISKNFPSDRLKNLFMEAEITFHLILMKSPKTLLSEDLDLKEVAQDYEECFRDISRSTGGFLTFSNKALDALKDAAEKEDYYYLIAYQSKAPLEARGKNIEVKVRREGAKVYNLKQLLKLGSPAVKITDVQAGRKTLKFCLKNYTMIKTEKGAQGIVEVSVMVFDDRSEKAFSEAKVMDIVKEEIHITINLDILKQGPYFLIIDALDKITGEKDVYSSIIDL